MMGWTSTGDPYANVGDSALTFKTEADAKSIAERHGWNYTSTYGLLFDADQEAPDTSNEGKGIFRQLQMEGTSKNSRELKGSRICEIADNHGKRDPMTSPEKRCLYEVLGLPRDCSPDEIRSAYRKLALQRHPDKLIKSGVSEAEATASFQELVNAYEVLSDVRERTWYDSHRSQILFSNSNSDKSSSGSAVVPDLMSFSNSVYSGFSDKGKGFYKVYADVFDKIYRNELNFAKKLGLGDVVKEAPLMGNLDSPYAQVNAFYGYWLGFVIVMDFVWEDEYDATAGPNRKSRRLMEDENKKIRKKAKREYNETVRGLAEFVNKKIWNPPLLHNRYNILPAPSHMKNDTHRYLLRPLKPLPKEPYFFKTPQPSLSANRYNSLPPTEHPKSLRLRYHHRTYIYEHTPPPPHPCFLAETLAATTTPLVSVFPSSLHIRLFVESHPPCTSFPICISFKISHEC
ncbi:hypothetical protein LXL04_015275 [Taraxacum kok-saghyz]